MSPHGPILGIDVFYLLLWHAILRLWPAAGFMAFVALLALLVISPVVIVGAFAYDARHGGGNG